MKRLLWSLLAMAGLHSQAVFAQDEAGSAVLDKLDWLLVDIPNLIFSSITLGSGDDAASLPLIVVWLIIGAVIFTVYFKFINLRGFAQGFRLIRGDYSDPNAKGEVTHFQALATAVSGTVGLGNIAGVAIAVSMGGPGATFWMILAGFLGMASKFCECTLGVMYRNELPDGRVSGGPMYYLSKGLAEKGKGMARFGKVLAVVFAICCIGGALGGGNMFLVNQALAALQVITGGEESYLIGKGWMFGLVMAVFAGLVIIGGLKSIARVTGKIVPFMAALYIVAGLTVIGVNYEQVPGAFAAIYNGAFNPDAIKGGIIGVLIVGFQRAAFSNEAGIGSASIAHSAVKTNEPVTEGLVALWEPFIDTIVICTITALVIITTNSFGASNNEQAVVLTSSAFGSVISWFPYLLAVAVVLFAFSTMLAWSYYGMKSWTYLFGEGNNREMVFKLIFLSFTVIGSILNLSIVQYFSDAMIFAMAAPNIIGLYILMPTVKRALVSYLARVKNGEIRNFRTSGRP